MSVKVVDFQREQAIRLWKDGRLREARKAMLSMLRERAGSDTDEELIIRKDLALIERDSGNLKEALRILLEASALAEGSSDLSLKGRFHNTLATVHHLLKDYDQTFQEYTAAAFYHEESGNLSAAAYVKNNIGWVLIDAGKPDDALSYLEEAERIFIKVGDISEIAQVLDTRARAHLKRGAMEEALDAAMKSVEYLRNCGEPVLLSKSLDTLAEVCFAKRIYDALIHSDGSITDAAHFLGIKHNTSLNYILETKLPQFLYLRKPKTHSRRKK